MALIKGDQMRERLQELLRSTTQNDEGKLKSREKKAEDGDGKFSYAGSFTRND